MSDGSAGSVLSEWLSDQLVVERQLRDSLAQRSALVVSSAATLVTLTLGGATLFTKTIPVRLPVAAFFGVLGAVVMLILAAVVSLGVNTPRKQASFDIEQVKSVVGALGSTSIGADRIRGAIRSAELEVLEDLRKRNDKRGRMLTSALILETSSLVFLGVSAILILLTP